MSVHSLHSVHTASISVHCYYNRAVVDTLNLNKTIEQVQSLELFHHMYQGFLLTRGGISAGVLLIQLAAGPQQPKSTIVVS